MHSIVEVFLHSQRGCAFHFVEIQSAFCLYLQNEYKFLTKFSSFDPSFNRSTLILLYLKSKTSAYAQIALIHYYILLSISFLIDMILILNLHWGYFLTTEVGQ